MPSESGPGRRIPLVQYWHDTDPPPEVLQCLGSWRKAPGFERELFDDVTAGAFLVRHFDERTYRAFSSCDLPEMRADLFRYAALLLRGGAYVDADAYNFGGAAALFASADRGMLFLRGADEPPAEPGWRPGRIPNGLMYVRHPGDAAIAAVLEQAISNIEGRVSNNVWEVTGPGIMTAVWGRGGPEAEEFFRGFTIESFEETARKVARFGRLPYKDGPRYWGNHERPDFGSIFREPQPPPAVGRRIGASFSMTMFRRAVELDRDRVDQPSLVQRLRTQMVRTGGRAEESSFYDDYVGPRQVRRTFTWIHSHLPDADDVAPPLEEIPQRVRRLAGISAQRDRQVFARLGLREPGANLGSIGRYNAQDYLLQRLLAPSDSLAPRTILDVGAGYGRQANLAFHSGDDVTATLIAVEEAPGAYLTQRAYFAALGLELADYIEERRRGREFDVAALAETNDVVHLPTWRLDLVPDGSVDLALLVQLSQKLEGALAARAITEISRVLKPGATLYIRDQPACQGSDATPPDQLLLASGLEPQSPPVWDPTGVAGAPRIWRKPDQAATP